MEMTTCRLVRATLGLSSTEVWATDLPIGAPHATVGGIGTEGSYPWTWIAQGSTRRLGHSSDAR